MIKKITLSIIATFISLGIAGLYLKYSKIGKPVYSIKASGTLNCYRSGSYYWSRLKTSTECTLHSNLGDFEDLPIKTNSLGLRNKEIEPKKDGVKRILFIGDSFTFGWGVKEEDSYPRYVEQRFDNVEVINAGQPNSAPDFYYLYLKNDGLKLDPNIVVIGFDIYQDIYNIRFNSQWTKVDDQGLPIHVDNDLAYIDNEGNQRSKKIETKDNSISPLEAKKKIGQLFEAMNDELKKTNKTLLVVIIPPALQVDSDIRRDAGIIIPAQPTQRDNQEFKNFFEKRGIEYIDLLPMFLASPQKDNLYYKKDGHWNANGHILAGQAIVQKIQELKLLPQ